jgi:hypothetical protein
LTAPIVLFLVFGASFGLLTYSRRHLFSEGPSRAQEPEPGLALGGRVLWMLICSCLWPLMALTGLLSLWKLSRVPVVRR